MLQDVILILEDLPEILGEQNLILEDVIELEEELEEIFTDQKLVRSQEKKSIRAKFTSPYLQIYI